jgi:hypothetical protein
MFWPDVPNPYAYGIQRAYTNPGNGSWDGSIGKGGGGGVGGFRIYAHMEGMTVVLNTGYVIAMKLAADGGKGSFSFANPSVFGPGQPGTLHTGSSTNPILPGGGGGAKANKTLKYGSHASGFSPDGCVFIRLYKIA